MIIYGTKAPLLKTEYAGIPCPNCKTNHSIQISIFQRYAHVFWIPFFPIGKTGVSVCGNCRQVLKLKEMPADLRLSYDNLKLQTKTPIWTFSGLGIVAVIAIGVTIHGQQNEKKIANLINKPKAGDIAQIKEKENQYTLYKVVDVKKDSVYLVINKYQTDDENDISNLEVKGFDTAVNAISKPAYAAMYKDNKILDIDRK
jgi:hypothetical protein